MTTGSRHVRTLGAVLILVVGLLNFHLPHFLLEAARPSDSGSVLLELALLANVLGAVVAAAGIAANVRWGWLLGILIVGVSVGLYVAQETVGLPGLPQNWWEPSRILSLVIEALFVVLARHQVVTWARQHQPGTR
jgi:hypothetical protein